MKKLVLLCIALFVSTTVFAFESLQDNKIITSKEAKRTADFTNSLGVGVHMGATNEVYGNLDNVINNLSYLGFKHLRDSMGGTQARGSEKLERFAKLGIYNDVIIGSNPQEYKNWLDKNAQYIESIEGSNEPDVFRGTNSAEIAEGQKKQVEAAVANQKELYNMIKSDSLLANKPVLTPSICEYNNVKVLADVKNYADYSNVHSYPIHGLPPYTTLPVDIKEKISLFKKPVIMTETGYSTNNKNGKKGNNYKMVSENVQLNYELDSILDNFSSGVVRTYLYVLFDEPNDVNNTDKENHFGLFHADNTPKPLAIALHNLMTILNDSGHSATKFKTNPLYYSIEHNEASSAADGLRSLLLQKENGTHELVLWQEPNIWDYKTMNDLVSTTNHLIVDFKTAYNINIYDPTLSESAIKKLNANNVKIDVKDHPVIIEILP